MFDHANTPPPHAQTLQDPQVKEAWERACNTHAGTAEHVAHAEKQLTRTRRRLAVSYALLDRWQWPLRRPAASAKRA